MRIKELKENTTAGSIASVAQPMGSTQSRSKSIFKGKKTKKKFYEGKIKDIAYDLEHLDNANFKKKYNKTKDEVKASLKESTVSEAELSEQDLILVPGQMKGKDNSFIPHEKDRRDHEVEMARKELYAAAKDAMRIIKQIQNRSEDEGLMGWQQSYITLASDYLNSVADSLENVPMKEGAGVIAGGMSNFEESKDEPSLDAEKLEKLKKLLYRNRSNTKEFGKKASLTTRELNLIKNEIKRLSTKANVPSTNEMKGRYYNPLDQERREQDAMDQERRDFKRREMEYELRGEEEAARRANEGPWYIRIDGKLVRDKNKDPYVFNTLEAARKAAQTMMKKDWNKGKQFTMTRSITEGMSAAVKLQRAFDREKSKSDASRERGKEELEKARKEYDKKQGKCPECGGEMVSEELMNEKKDACYYKVKSRYKVWPSAYASGALVKCRKKGASNWGNKSK